MASIQPGDIINEGSLLSDLSNDTTVHTSWLQSLDAILILGGGVPLSPKLPPVYVQRRCDVVAELLHTIDKQNSGAELPKIICLSAGTAHLAQYILPNDGLPLWESTSSAAYLINHPKYPVDGSRIFVETTSYDTISNAYFTRTTFTDVAGWEKILVVTNEFHIHRSKAIFDWIFNVPSEKPSNYELYYLSCNNDGLSNDALDARRAHEARGETNVRTKLAQEYTTLKGVFNFLTVKHDFYTAEKLVKRATDSQGEKVRDALLELSYGRANDAAKNSKSIIKVKDGKLILTVDAFTAMALLGLVAGVCLFFLQNTRGNKVHVR